MPLAVRRRAVSCVRSDWQKNAPAVVCEGHSKSEVSVVTRCARTTKKAIGQCDILASRVIFLSPPGSTRPSLLASSTASSGGSRGKRPRKPKAKRSNLGTFKADASRIILGKMRKLAGLRIENGVVIDERRWAQAIARVLSYWGADLSTRDLQFRMENVGLRRLDTDIAQGIVWYALSIKHNGPIVTPKELGREIGKLLDLKWDEREEIRFWNAEATNEKNAEGRERRRRERAALKRRTRHQKDESAIRA